MSSFSFSIAKKMERQTGQEPGLQLSSLKADRGSGSAVLIGADNASVKEAVAAFRNLTGLPIGCRSRGKSLQIFSDVPELSGADAMAVLLEFLKELSFGSEDVLDVLEFCGLPGVYPFGTLRLESVDMDRSRAEIRAAAEVSDEDFDPETVYGQLMPVLEKYDMGVIKQ